MGAVRRVAVRDAVVSMNSDQAQAGDLGFEGTGINRRRSTGLASARHRSIDILTHGSRRRKNCQHSGEGGFTTPITF